MMMQTLVPWAPAPPEDATLDDRLAWYVEVARFAPSKHNSQPWRFVLRDGALLVWADAERALPLTDPSGREQLLSCGAAIELAVVAAASVGRQLAVTWIPDPGGTLLARLTETGSRVATDDDAALLAAAATRRTDRGPLDAGPLSPSTPFELQRAAFGHGAELRLVVTSADRQQLADLVTQADRMLARGGLADAELVSWRRAPGDASEDGVPASHTRGVAASYRAEFVQRDFGAGMGVDPAMDREGADAPLVGIICTTADQAVDWLVAGRALAAVLLRAQVLGAHASYLNQPCEVVTVRSALQHALGLSGHPQVVLRLGAGGDVTATPRRDLELVLTKSPR